MPVQSGDAQALAQAGAEAEETIIIVGNPEDGAATQAGASAPAPGTTSTPPAATGVEPGQDGVAAGASATDDGPAADDGAGDDSAAEYTEEDLIALQELEAYFQQQAEQSVVPKIQSTYDRQIAQLNRQIQAAEAQAKAREEALQAQVREAQLNGLSDEERAKLQQRWDYEDRQRLLDEQTNQLGQYHMELLRTAYAQEYADFGLLPEDLLDIETPEEMDAFVKDVELEYYRQLAEARAAGGAPAAVASRATQPAAKPTQKAAPAGVSAPSDGGSGGAVPAATQFNDKTGRGAMADNIRGGWESLSFGQ